ncbi:WD40/YVTN/BNR-like repeat-containing protein [Sorangium cellulosum]|nr:sialidase family protein [Sorangium cellulosum]
MTRWSSGSAALVRVSPTEARARAAPSMSHEFDGSRFIMNSKIKALDENTSQRFDWADRHRSIERREQWFYLDRSRDDREFSGFMDRARSHKRRMIGEQRETARDLAGYGPAGAGSPWYNIGPRNVNGRVKSLAVHPTNANIVYAGAASGGVWKSTDGGQSWRALWDEQETLVIGSIAVAQSAPDTVYVGTGEWTPGYAAAGPGEGVYVSTDGGATWARRAAVLARRVARVLVSPTTATTVYVAGDQGFERSTDSGTSWATLRAGQISDAVIDPTNADVIYIAVRNDGIYKSTDGGGTWNLLGNGPTGASADWLKLALGTSGAHGTEFVAAKRSGALYTSTDGGATWTALAGSHGSAPHHTWANLLAVAPDDEAILLAGGVSAQRTADGGATWSNLGVLHADHHIAVFAPSNTSVVYACNDGGLYRSTDKGATWKKASDGMVVTQFYDVGVWETISTVVGGGTQDQGTTMTTGGLTWRHIQNTHDGGYFVISPTDPRTMYEEYQNTVIHKSTDGGNTWTLKTGGLVGSSPWTGVICMHPTNHSILYTGTDRVFRTTDGCATDWAQSSQSLAGSVTSIAVAKSNPSRVYAAAGGHIYRSDDGGATNPWTDRTSAALPSGRTLRDIAVSATNADRVLVCYGGVSGSPAASHVFLSTDGGTTWADVSGNLPNINTSAVAFDPNAADTFYVGNDVGVFRTTDAGATWIAYDNGMPNVIVTDLAVDAEDNRLYAATFGRGMYKLDITPSASRPAVDLYLRDSVLDTGERSPSPSGHPNPADGGDTVHFWESPDIKVEVTPYYAPDAVFDGVEFDEEVAHDDPIRGQVARFYLQVHNRGYENATNVRVRAFFADASLGLPALPNALTPPNFDLASTVDWKPVGAAKTIAVLEPNRPVVVSWDWEVPATTATHSCLLAVVSSNEDPITTAETNADTLVRSEKRVCLKNLHVIDSPGPRPAQSLVTVKLHNAENRKSIVDLVVKPEGLGVRGVLGVLLERVSFVDPVGALVNATKIPLQDGENVGEWYRKPGDRVKLDRTELLKRLDRTVLYDLDPTRTSEIRGIELGAGQTMQAVISCKGTHKIPYGATQRFAVMQRQNGKIVGGSTFEIRLRRAKALHPVSRIRIILERVRILDDQDPWLKGRGEMSFRCCVTLGSGAGRRHTARLPEAGVVKISDQPGRNEHRFDACIFDGYVAEADAMLLEVFPTEHDWLDRDDPLCAYRRQFSQPPETWVGNYRPNDEGPGDAERRPGWELDYRIESLPLR